MNAHRDEIIAIIPARGGSKGIPRKNLVVVGGAPLLAHSIRQARACPRIGRVFVSTDDDEIARTARSEGAEVVMRPAWTAVDTASSESALLHALDEYRTVHGSDPSLVVFLQATSPLRGRDDISNAIGLLEREGADSLFSACTLEGFLWRRSADGLYSFSYDYRRRPRRQEAPEDLMENGSIYVFKPWVLREHENRLGGKIAVYCMDRLHSFQIDTPEDIALFEKLFLVANTQSGAAA
ncbi:MAG: acylneuraminate cytidylyltransferase family protein [Bacteroidota bacterium]|nr:acylneuraminate cytidylyltransferase family protein [Bacteroidota bacterium]